MSFGKNNVSHVLSRLDGASVVGGRVKMCLYRISWDSVGAGLRWICLDLVFVRIRLGVYRFDPSIYDFLHWR